jgi:hypothetical protein
MGEIRPANGKALQIDALEFLPTSSQILDLRSIPGD